MGFTPQQIDKMSMWEFYAALDGYVDANLTEDNSGQLSPAEIEELSADVLARG